ncbi:MAG: hypothetical protein WKG07_45145 [Hymenobacter sp.]
MVVVSALGGTTDALISAGRAAAAGDESFRQTLRQLEARHHRRRGPAPYPRTRADVQPWLTAQFAELARLVDGIFALGELSPRTLDRLMSYGELLSSRIIAAAFAARGVANSWADSRQLIRTNSRFGMALVEEEITQRQVAYFQQENPTSLWVAPGFIAADAEGHTTTLGRGGSDYSAAILAAALARGEARNLDRREWDAHR